MDDESEGDWEPPPEVELIESEVFLIPSGLPSLEDFIRIELEKEALAALDAEEELSGASDVEVDKTTAAEQPTEELAQEGSATDVTAAAAEDAGPTIEEEEPEEDAMDMAEVKVAKKPVKKAVEVWQDLDVLMDFGELKQEIENKAKEELRLRIIESTHEYIQNLIAKVVELSEYEDPDEILRTRLDKAKVLPELDEKMFLLEVEQKIRNFLNRKTVEYFRRKKSFRPLMDDSPDQLLPQLSKYRDALTMVNKNQGRENETQKLLQSKIADMKKKAGELETIARQSERQLYHLVKKVFLGDSSEKMGILIDYLMHKMKNMRKEISKVRFVLIQRQHTIATLQDRARKMEDLGNGLRMVDFEHLQTETQALGKKIEERNNELNRLHSRCNADIHTLAHIREKQHMIRNTIAAQQEAYDGLVQEKQDCREHLNTLKMNRGYIRREVQRISFQGGILDKPDLLLDYDVAMDKATNLRARISEMKASQEVIDIKLKYMMRSLQ